MIKLIKTILLIITLSVSSSASAHTTSTSYLNIDLKQEFISGDWQVNIEDLHLKIGLDNNIDSKITWSDIIAQQQKIILELNNSILISSNKQHCDIKTKAFMIDRRTDNIYLNIPFISNCAATIAFKIHYNFLFEQDAFHKAILSISDNKNSYVNIMSYSTRNYQHQPNSSSTIKSLIEFIVQGIIHVLIGLDHVLFVICLLLSASLLNKTDKANIRKLKPLLINTFKLITTFTVAHSITLILASTKILSVSPNIIEPIIALSVIVLALLNLFNKGRFRNLKHWPIVFVFGLIHGFGFAFVLEEVVVQPDALFISLFGFNFGVELGQLLIVFSVLPFLYLLYSKKYYQQIIIPVSSIVIASVGLMWLIERTVVVA